MTGAVTVRLLIIHRQLRFSLKVKRTLEQLGGFEVKPFTTLETAAEYLQANPQHIALIDFALPRTKGIDIVKVLRETQSNLLLIATPDMPEVVAVAHQMGFAAVIETPLATRELVSVLRNVLLEAQDTLPETAEPPIIDDNLGSSGESSDLIIRTDETMLESSSGFSVNPQDPDYDAKIQNKTRNIELVLNAHTPPEQLPEGMSQSAMQTFQRLASEEPPMPSDLDTNTVYDLKDAMRDELDVEKVAHAMQNIVYIKPQLPDGSDAVDEDSPVAGALKALTDDSLSLTDLRESMRDEFPETQGIKPLPSWKTDRERYVEEPDFLGDVSDTPPESKTVKPEDPPEPADDPPPDDKRALAVVAEDEPSILADLALKLTQYSLEVSAEATLLTEDEAIIAHAGKMPIEDINALGEGINHDWNAQPGEARIRFVTLESSGQDYMIHTRRTEHGFALSMIFSGNMQFRAMRLQSDRLLAALQLVPELEADKKSLIDELQEREMQQLEAEAAHEVEAAIESSQVIEEEHGVGLAATFDEDALAEMPQLPAPDFAGALTPYTFLWVTADEQDAIPAQMAQIMSRELERQLNELGWEVESLQVHEDYVYLLADAPGETPSHQIIQDLKQRAGLILQVIHKTIDPETCWADSYCVLAPGREMDMEEIQRYINFARLS
jgi:DNA-binding response OmpR family regulator/REP element-mobilizing transposase RayT